jgi:hypothetical protein
MNDHHIQMIIEVTADAGQAVPNHSAVRPELRSRCDTRQQQLWRSDLARRRDDAASRYDACLAAAPHAGNRHCAIAGLFQRLAELKAIFRRIFSLKRRFLQAGRR